MTKKARMRGGDRFDHAVGEILLRGIAGQIVERQHRDRRLVGKRQRRRRAVAGRSALRSRQRHPVDANRPGNVAQRLRAQILERGRKLARRLVVNGAGHIELARCAQRLEPGRDIHAVAVDVVALDNDVADIDADAELDPARIADIGVAAAQGRQNRQRAIDRVDGARKLHQKPVTH